MKQRAHFIVAVRNRIHIISFFGNLPRPPTVTLRSLEQNASAEVRHNLSSMREMMSRKKLKRRFFQSTVARFSVGIKDAAFVARTFVAPADVVTDLTTVLEVGRQSAVFAEFPGAFIDI